MLTGGFTMPPRTITGSVEDDLRIVDKVIGVGEIAISDRRACDPCLVDLARLVTQARRGASLSVKSGVTLFHVGDGKRRLQPREALLDQHDIAPSSIVADHVNRTPEHVEEAVRLARRGAHVCMDTVDGPFPEWIQHYRATGGPADKLSVCSDAHTAGGDVANFAAALFDSARDGTLLDELLLAFTANTADVWQLPRKGRVQSDAMRTCYWSPPTL
jgi:beta-aspartyl-dipeptidase (metallo-type)